MILNCLGTLWELKNTEIVINISECWCFEFLTATLGHTQESCLQWQMALKGVLVLQKGFMLRVFALNWSQCLWRSAPQTADESTVTIRFFAVKQSLHTALKGCGNVRIVCALVCDYIRLSALNPCWIDAFKASCSSSDPRSDLVRDIKRIVHDSFINTSIHFPALFPIQEEKVLMQIGHPLFWFSHQFCFEIWLNITINCTQTELKPSTDMIKTAALKK